MIAGEKSVIIKQSFLEIIEGASKWQGYQVAAIGESQICVVDMLWKRYLTHKNVMVERELLVETVAGDGYVTSSVQLYLTFSLGLMDRVFCGRCKQEMLAIYFEFFLHS
jgi:hypothetical protein